MSSNSAGIPRVAVLGTASGLILMAFFTVLWGSWSLVGLSGPLAVAVIVAFSSLGVVFVVEGVRLLRGIKGLVDPQGVLNPGVLVP